MHANSLCATVAPRPGAPPITHVLVDARLTNDGEPVAAAARIARAHRAKLTLLHVLPRLPGDAGPMGTGPLCTRVRLARRRAAFQRMVALHPHESRLTWLVVEGDPGAEIVRAAVRHAVDLIVLDGARAASGDGDGGRAVRYVIDRAPCRIEVVRAPAPCSLSTLAHEEPSMSSEPTSEARSNPSSNPSLSDVIAAGLSRRRFMAYGLGAAAAALAPPLASPARGQGRPHRVHRGANLGRGPGDGAAGLYRRGALRVG